MGVLVFGGYIVLTAAAVIALLLCAAIVIGALWGDEGPPSERVGADR